MGVGEGVAESDGVVEACGPVAAEGDGLQVVELGAGAAHRQEADIRSRVWGLGEGCDLVERRGVEGIKEESSVDSGFCLWVGGIAADYRDVDID